MTGQPEARIDGRPTLALYVEDGCPSCAAAQELARRAGRDFPALAVRVISLSVSSEEAPEGVFAAPTFMLNGQVVSLGTPTWDQLCEALSEAFGEEDYSR
jgi:hypothetical protein